MKLFDMIKAKFWLDTAQDLTGLDPMFIRKDDLDTLAGEKLDTEGLADVLTLTGSSTADMGDELWYLKGD